MIYKKGLALTANLNIQPAIAAGDCLRVINILLKNLKRQDLFGSNEGGVTMVACLRFALVLVVVARWSMDLDVIFIISCVCCITMIDRKFFPQEKKIPKKQSREEVFFL